MLPLALEQKHIWHSYLYSHLIVQGMQQVVVCHVLKAADIE